MIRWVGVLVITSVAASSYTHVRLYGCSLGLLDPTVHLLKKQQADYAGAQAEMPPTPSPSTLAHESAHRALMKPASEFDCSPNGRTGASEMLESAPISDEAGSRPQSLPESGFNDYAVTSRSDPPIRQDKQQDSGVVDRRQYIAGAKALAKAAHGNLRRVDSSERGLQSSLAQGTGKYIIALNTQVRSELTSNSIVNDAQTAWDYLCNIHPSLKLDFPSRPSNPKHLPLLDLQITRESMSNPSRQDATWSATSSKDMTAILCHITGSEQSNSCRRCQTGCGIFDRCVVAPSGDSQAVMAGQCSNCFIDECGQCTWDDGHHPAPEQGPAECLLSASNKCLPLSQPNIDDNSSAARVGATLGHGTSDPQPDHYTDQDELSDLSDVEEPSDEEFAANGEELIGNGDADSPKAQSQDLTQKTITYDEVYQAARDPQARYKHCKYSGWTIFSILISISEIASGFDSRE